MASSNAAPNITYSAELGRKMIHLSSLGIPLVAWWLPRWLSIMILMVMFLLSVLVDLERSRASPLGRFLNRAFGFMIRPHEKKPASHGRIPLAGSTWMLFAAILTFALFSREIAVAGFTMLIVCDTVAALVGRRFGTLRFGPRGKSLEGTAAFFAAGILVIAVVPDLPWLVGIPGAATAAIAEALPWDWDDNLTVPLFSGFVMTIASALVGMG